MRWLKEHGLIGTYDDYSRLPLTVLEDALLVMEFEVNRAELEARRGKR